MHNPANATRHRQSSFGKILRLMQILSNQATSSDHEWEGLDELEQMRSPDDADHPMDCEIYIDVPPAGQIYSVIAEQYDCDAWSYWLPTEALDQHSNQIVEFCQAPVLLRDTQPFATWVYIARSRELIPVSREFKAPLVKSLLNSGTAAQQSAHSFNALRARTLNAAYERAESAFTGEYMQVINGSPLGYPLRRLQPWARPRTAGSVTIELRYKFTN